MIVHKTLVGTCVFKTNNTDIGTLVGTDGSGSTAKLEIGAKQIPQMGENPFCPESATWSGSYTITTPDVLYVD